MSQALLANEVLIMDNLSLRALPTEPAMPGPSYPRQVRGFCFSRVAGPTPVRNPQLVAFSVEALELLGWGHQQASAPDFAEFMCGNRLLVGAEPAAHCYAGHQFGYFSGQLGDGAAMYLGEVINPAGERWELQLKGAGLTPYSRAADGRKVLRSSVREFLASEAMYHLGIPTTRSASVVTSDTRVVRDPQYNGNSIQERATVITRIAPTFLRFGSFEICKPLDPGTGRAGPSAGLEHELLPVLLHHTIRTYFPDIWTKHDGDKLASTNEAAKLLGMYRDWFREVTCRTASLVAGWQSVGFCHGVLNTDNMSILGLTIDYGPYGFLDAYDPAHVCNGSDDGARYTYEAQPAICRWNCGKLAECLSAIMPLSKGQVEEELQAYDKEYERCYNTIMRRKLGLVAAVGEEASASDAQLVADLFGVMKAAGSDFTNTFRLLSRVPLPSPLASTGTAKDVGAQGTAAGTCGGQPAGNGASPTPGAAGGGVAMADLDTALGLLVAEGSDAQALSQALGPRMPAASLQMLAMLARNNPTLLHQLGTSPQAVQQELDRHKAAQALLKVSPADKAGADRESWSRWLQRYTARLQLEADAGVDNVERRKVMDGANPRIVLRNWMAHQAIQRADGGDFSAVRKLLDSLKTPFAGGEGRHPQEVAGTADGGAAGAEDGVCPYDGKVPAWARGLCVTCSS